MKYDIKHDMPANVVVNKADPFLPKYLPNNPLIKKLIKDKKITNKYILIMLLFTKNKTKESVI